MWRVSQCCCGCSLKTGTLILLWLDLLNCSSSLPLLLSMLFSSAINHDGHVGLLIISVLVIIIITLIVTIYALVGAMKHRPSYMFPYIIRFVLGLILILLATVCLLITFALTDKIIDSIYNVNSERKSLHHSSSYALPPERRDMIRHQFRTAFFLTSVFCLFGFILEYYFFCVIYSYYKQMQEEDNGTYNRGTGVVYSAPQGQPGTPGRRPQPVAVLYPQAEKGHPPQYAPNRMKL